jgi:hypothetical protein
MLAWRASICWRTGVGVCVWPSVVGAVVTVKSPFDGAGDGAAAAAGAQPSWGAGGSLAYGVGFVSGGVGPGGSACTMGWAAAGAWKVAVGGGGSGRSGWRRWAGLPGSSRRAVVAAAVDRLWVSTGQLVGLTERPPLAGRALSGCESAAVRECLLGPSVAAGNPVIPVLGAGALAVVVGCASVA